MNTQTRSRARVGKQTLMVFVTMLLAFFSVFAAQPALADTVGDEYSDTIVGNIKNDGIALQGVQILGAHLLQAEVGREHPMQRGV